MAGEDCVLFLLWWCSALLRPFFHISHTMLSFYKRRTSILQVSNGTTSNNLAWAFIINFARLDYMGISLLIIGSFIPWIYYGFYCRMEPKITYIAMVSVLGVGEYIWVWFLLNKCSLFDFWASEVSMTLAGWSFQVLLLYRCGINLANLVTDLSVQVFSFRWDVAVRLFIPAFCVHMLKHCLENLLRYIYFPILLS